MQRRITMHEKPQPSKMTANKSANILQGLPKLRLKFTCMLQEVLQHFRGVSEMIITINYETKPIPNRNDALVYKNLNQTFKGYNTKLSIENLFNEITSLTHLISIIYDCTDR